MNYSIRRKLDMAGRVRDFCRTHPAPDNAGYTAAVARLEELLDRAGAMAQQQVSGQLTVSGAVVNKSQLRREVREMIGLVAGLARAAAREAPDLSVGIERNPPSTSDRPAAGQGGVTGASALEAEKTS